MGKSAKPIETQIAITQFSIQLERDIEKTLNFKSHVIQVHQTIISAVHCLIGLMICGLSHLREQFANEKFQREIFRSRTKIP